MSRPGVLASLRPRIAGAGAEKLVDELSEQARRGVDHVVMDFGHPRSTEPVLRVAEQVIAPLRG